MVAAAGDDWVRGKSMDEYDWDAFDQQTAEYLQHAGYSNYSYYDAANKEWIDTRTIDGLGDISPEQPEFDGFSLEDAINGFGEYTDDSYKGEGSDDSYSKITAPNAPIIKQNSKGDGGLLDSMLKKVEDPKVLSALITAGMGMLNGASQGKMLEKKWKREDDIRQQEIARKNANSKPGAVGKMTWTPANPQGTGLLGAKVG